jgi:hypothetical protein
MDAWSYKSIHKHFFLFYFIVIFQYFGERGRALYTEKKEREGGIDRGVLYNIYIEYR